MKTRLWLYPLKALVAFIVLQCLIRLEVKAQQSVSIGTEQIKNNAVLWLNSPNKNQGLIIPIVTNRTGVTGEAGMIVFDDSDDKIYYHNGSGWIEVGGSGSTAASGDLSGNYPNPTVVRLQGRPIANTAPTTGQVLKWNGTQWSPQSDDAGSLPALTANQIISSNGTSNTAVTVSGDATLNGTSGALTINNGAVNSAKILDGSITNADVNNSAAIAVAKLAAGTNGQILTTTGGIPVWSAAVTTLDGLSDAQVTTPAGGQILVHNGSGNFQNRTVTGDVTVNATGVVTIANNAVNSAKIVDGTIANGDISNTAAIAVNKLASGTNGQILTTSGGAATWTTPIPAFSTANVIPKGDGSGLVASNLYDNGANIGIGTTSPTRVLDLNSGIASYGYSHSDGTIRMSTYTGTLSGGGVGGSIGTESDHPFYIYVANSGEKATFLQNGNVGIGTNAPAQRLDVSGNIRLTGYIYFSSGKYLFHVPSTYSGIDDHWIPNLSNTYDLGTASWRWRTLYTITNPNVSSDFRLKSHIQDLSYGLDEILNLRPVSYYFKDDKEEQLKLGLIAQEAQKIIPEIVMEDKSPDKYLGITYSDLIPVLIKAIQEQQQEVEELKKQVEDLKKYIGLTKN